MAYTPIQEVRVMVQDTAGPGLYFLADEEIQYLLDRNNSNINRASIEAARLILLKLSMRTDSTVDVLSVRNSKAAENYRLALQLYLRDPNLNPLLQNITGWIGGTSKSEMQANDLDADNNVVLTPETSRLVPNNFPTDFFSI